MLNNINLLKLGNGHMINSNNIQMENQTNVLQQIKDITDAQQNHLLGMQQQEQQYQREQLASQPQSNTNALNNSNSNVVIAPSHQSLTNFTLLNQPVSGNQSQQHNEVTLGNISQ